MTRCFVALELPKEIKDEIIKIQSMLQADNLMSARYTNPENIHLTLKFLGELDDETIKKVRQRLSTVKVDAVDISLGELGVFTPRNIRIVWVKLDGADELQRKIDEALKGLFEMEQRFMGHITIARPKKVEKMFLESLNDIKVDNISAVIGTFSLMSSDLTGEGPKYKTIKTFPVA